MRKKNSMPGNIVRTLILLAVMLLILIAARTDFSALLFHGDTTGSGKPTDNTAAGTYASGNYTSGTYASGNYTSGTYASGNYTSGNYASGNYTSGAHASGSYAAEEPFSDSHDSGIQEYALLFDPSEPSCSTCTAAPGLIPPFDGEDYVVLNGNVPNFTEYDLFHIRGETYSELDRLGRCGTAVAMLDRSMMPGKSREYVNSIKPTGWHTVKYPDLIEERYLYNRCHLIAYAMTGQNENERNLITGTRYMNVESMLPFELKVLHYLDETGQQVLYRVTPYFKGNDLVARGVEMEAFSTADSGRSICFHVFVYNYQPGITIDYRTGESRRKS